MSTQETETQTQTTEEEAVDIEPIIRNIIREENQSVTDRLTALEEALGPLGELGDTLEGLFKKHKTPATKIDEDSLVEKITAKLTGGNHESGNGNGGDESTGRKPGPLSRWLGIS